MGLDSSIIVRRKITPKVMPKPSEADLARQEEVKRRAKEEFGEDMEFEITTLGPGGFAVLEDNIVFSDTLDAVNLTPLQVPEYPLVVEVSVAYWRKANHIHGWWMRESGIPEEAWEIFNRLPVPVKREQMAHFVEVCKTVLNTVVRGPITAKQDSLTGPYLSFEIISIDKAVARMVFPPVTGFFFGDDEIDWTWVEALDDAVSEISAVLDDPSFLADRFYYYGDW